jgi:hypothetical protein
MAMQLFMIVGKQDNVNHHINNNYQKDGTAIGA